MEKDSLGYTLTFERTVLNMAMDSYKEPEQLVHLNNLSRNWLETFPAISSSKDLKDGKKRNRWQIRSHCYFKT